MDCACYIRKKSVMALWVITPLTLCMVIWASAFAVVTHQQHLEVKIAALEKMIPQMEEALQAFEPFARDFMVSAGTRTSLEDLHLMLIGKAAERTHFALSAVNLAVEPLNGGTDGAVRIRITVRGNGTCYDITAFLNAIRELDPSIYERQLTVTPDSSAAGQLILDAELNRVCFRTPRGPL